MSTSLRQIARPRLQAALQGVQVTAIVAGGGYGKSALAAEVLDNGGYVGIRARVRADDLDEDGLLRALRQALERAGLEEAAEIVQATAPEPEGLADALHDGLVELPSPAMVFVEDIHRLSAGAAERLREALEELPRPHAAILCGRWLPANLRGLTERPDTALLSSDDLAFTPEEIVELGTAHGLELSRDDASLLARTTGGWASALSMILPALPADDPAAAVERHAEEPASLTALIDGLLERLDPTEADLAIQLAHLPLLDAALVDRIAERPGTLARLASAGLPVTPTRDGWWIVTAPVGEQLTARGALRPEAAEAAARGYELRGERREALGVLLRAGCEERAVALAAGWPDRVAVNLGPEPLQRLCGAVDEDVLRTDPRPLVRLARAYAHLNDVEGRAAALDRAEALAPPDPAMADEVEAERILAEMYVGRDDEVRERARELLARTGPDRPGVRAKALQAVARGSIDSRTEEDLRYADTLLGEAMGIWERLGEPYQLAQVALFRGLLVSWPLGEHEAAIAQFDTCLAHSGAVSRQRATALPFLGFVLTYAGRHDDAERCCSEALRLGKRLRNTIVQVYAHWGLARAASHRGDADATAAAVAEAERLGGDAFIDTAGGAYFLADAAQLLDRVGHTERAWELLGRAQAADAGTLGLVPLAAFALHARSGDPELAEQYLAQARERPSVEPRDEWRVALLLAEARRRAGDATAAAHHAREAFALAERTDVPDAPWVREAGLAARLAPLAQPSTPAGHANARTVVQLLDGFAVRRGDEDLTPPEGRLADLVKVLALHGGDATAEHVIDELWPDADAETGRTRLRRVLARLRRSSGDLVVRDGERLRLPDDTAVDHAAFVEAAREALTGTGATQEGARIALGLGGALLPDDTAEEWAVEARREVQRLRLALLDQVANAAAEAGDVDEAVRMLEEAIALVPYDESRYERAAALLEEAGRSGRARELRARLRSVLAGTEP